MESSQRLTVEAQIYGILSQMYSSPEDTHTWCELVVALRQAFALLDVPCAIESMEKIEAYLRDLPDTLPLAKEYVRLLRGPVRAVVYPYESLHIDGEVMGHSTQAVLELYGEAGLGMSQDFRDLPDHISAELEFMGYLCAKEAACVEDGDESGHEHFGRLRRSFLDNHLLKWLPSFTGEIIRNTVSPFYRDLAVATREFLSCQGITTSTLCSWSGLVRSTTTDSKFVLIDAGG